MFLEHKCKFFNIYSLIFRLFLILISKIFHKFANKPKYAKLMKRNYCLSFVFFAVLGLSISSPTNAAGNSDILASQSTQQIKKISGTIVDSKGEPIIGASVLVRGTGIGTITDIDGKFSLSASQGAVLVISYVGYAKKELTVGAPTVYKIVLVDDAQALSEVVVTAMGIKKEKKALGYSVQDIKSDELLKNKSANVINSLNGKVAGVNITQGGGAAGSGSQIVLRGGTSLERDNQPLFVIDGVIFDNGTNIGGDSGFDGAQRTSSTYSNRVMDINPEDVESMSVLKGPTAAALYGSRAAAGVIIITTKKGSEGNIQVNVSTKFSTNWVNRLPKQQSVYKRGTYNGSGVFSDFTTNSWGKKFAEGETVYDNVGDFFQNSSIFDNSASISGGGKNNSFFLSASRFDQDGIIPSTGYVKNTLRFNGEQKYGDLTVGANVAYTASSLDKTLTSGGLFNSSGTGAMEGVYGYSRSDDMKHYLNEDGTRWRMFKGLQKVEDDTDNPYWVVNKNKMTDKTNRLTGSINLNYNVASWMNIVYKAGIDRYTTTSRTLIAPGGGVISNWQNGMLSESNRTYEYLSSNLMLNFNKKIGDVGFNLLLGHTAEDTKIKTDREMGYNFSVDDIYSFNNILNKNKKQEQISTRRRLVGGYGEFRTSYKSLLYLSVTGRNDWTSTLPVANRSYFYPSFNGSFIFTELLPENNVLSFGKLRASYALVGKDADPGATTTTTWAPSAHLAGYGTSNSWTKGNPNLKPEKTKSTELGLEMRFFNGRLGFDYTYYSNKSINQIVNPRLSQTTGYILVSSNIGTITNKGMELSITGQPIKTKDLTWDMTLNLSGNRGKVNDLINGVSILYVTDVQVGNAKAASFNGGNFMAISGSKWARDPDGNVILDSKSGMPTYDGLATYEIGNREPKLIGGLNNSISYKGWNLSFLFDFRIGGDIYNGTDYYLTDAGLSMRSMNRESITIDGVVKNGDAYEKKSYNFDANKFYLKGVEVAEGTSNAQSGKYVIQQYYKTYYAYESSNYMTNTNWLRLRSVSLSYSFPKVWLAKTKFIKGLTANVSGTNLLLWTNYKGLDPENSAAGSGAVGSSSVGIDYCGVPSTAGMSFGLNFTF